MRSLIRPRRLAPVARLLLLALLCSAGARAAIAQQPSQAQASAIRQACRSDYTAHCADVPTGGKAALACLQQNLPSLSAGCQNAVSAVGGGAGAAAPGAGTGPAGQPLPSHPQPVREACRADFQRLCSNVRMGRGRALRCLMENRQSLSPGCAASLEAMRGAR